jgi:hypothetical protein
MNKSCITFPGSLRKSTNSDEVYFEFGAFGKDKSTLTPFWRKPFLKNTYQGFESCNEQKKITKKNNSYYFTASFIAIRTETYPTFFYRTVMVSRISDL